MPAAAFLIVFLQVAAIHGYQAGRSKSVIMAPMIVAAILEGVGYICRLMSHNESPNFTLVPYAIQSVLLLMAPTLISATIYLHAERVFVAVQADKPILPWKLRTYKRVFLLFDAFSLIIQTAGSVMRLTNHISWVRTGNRLVMTGVGEQMLFVLLFLFVAGKFQYNLSRNPTARVAGRGQGGGSLENMPVIPYAKHLYLLYASSAMVGIRCLIRLLETLYPTSIVKTSEVFLYVFDAGFMILIMKSFHFIHPSELEALIEYYEVAEGGQVEMGGEDAGRQNSQVYFAGIRFWQGKRLQGMSLPLYTPGLVESVDSTHVVGKTESVRALNRAHVGRY
ncbi:RTA1 like protein-domain-containing protein [Pseudomassariella vexata]|uniref:RTA1 like protein-domain-containing protein n=1 Tax=Pseudomassariella vexata TaxID=1141098 RepID=A0A1Y2EFM3_9PEZI|nr:RTA1 like protein-domain-containing protein [Pseudomassariella vexata]ORY70373.1 RTA1 like protein-domain-containing protein [Pseudomassariella vexata]